MSIQNNNPYYGSPANNAANAVGRTTGNVVRNGGALCNAATLGNPVGRVICNSPAPIRHAAGAVVQRYVSNQANNFAQGVRNDLNDPRYE